MTSVSEAVEKLEPSYSAGENIKQCHHFGKQFGNPQNAKHRVTSGPTNSIPRYIPKKNGNVCPHKDLHVNVCSSIIHNSQKETTQCSSTDKWINKMWYIHIIEYYSTIKKKKRSIDICYNVDKP